MNASRVTEVWTSSGRAGAGTGATQGRCKARQGDGLRQGSASKRHVWDLQGASQLSIESDRSIRAGQEEAEGVATRQARVRHRDTEDKK